MSKNLVIFLRWTTQLKEVTRKMTKDLAAPAHPMSGTHDIFGLLLQVAWRYRLNSETAGNRYVENTCVLVEPVVPRPDELSTQRMSPDL